jgi:hypothetical protein
MKKIVLFLLIVPCIATAANAQDGGDYVLLGQMYGTAQFGFPEKINGRVKELRQLNFFPAIEDGKVVKIRALTTADRVTAPSGRDYFEEYDYSGTVIKSGTMDENGKLIEYWDMDIDSSKIIRASYFTNDQLISDVRVEYTGKNLSEVRYYYPDRNTLIRRATIEYDKSGNRKACYFYNSRNLQTGRTQFFYNESNLLDSIKTFDIIGRVTMKFKYEHDAEGHRVSQYQENYSDGDKRLYHFDYEYDKMGNYIQVVFMKDNKPTIYRERQIKYFE